MFTAVSPDDSHAPATPESTLGSMSVVNPPTVKVEATITPDLLMTPGLTPEYHRPEKQPVRKRKSWGQVLPEPKTSLPPRKRAKTADEKEQRRIERVKRNRLAAHNSRERKREEMEVLQMHNDALVAKIQQLESELAAFRNGKTPSVPSFDFPQSTTAASSSPPAPTAVPDALLQPTLDLDSLSSPATELYSQPSTPVPEAFTPPAEEVSFVDPTQQSAVSVDNAYLQQPLFGDLSSNDAKQPPAVSFDGSSSILAQPPTLLLESLDAFLNLDHEQPSHPLPTSPTSLRSPDVFDDHASETSEYLDLFADSSARPPPGCDESGVFGFGISDDVSQLFGLEAFTA